MRCGPGGRWTLARTLVVSPWEQSDTTPHVSQSGRARYLCIFQEFSSSGELSPAWSHGAARRAGTAGRWEDRTGQSAGSVWQHTVRGAGSEREKCKYYTHTAHHSQHSDKHLVRPHHLHHLLQYYWLPASLPSSDNQHQQSLITASSAWTTL